MASASRTARVVGLTEGISHLITELNHVKQRSLPLQDYWTQLEHMHQTRNMVVLIRNR